MKCVDCSTHYSERHSGSGMSGFIISPKQSFLDTVLGTSSSKAVSALCRLMYKAQKLEFEYDEEQV